MSAVRASSNQDVASTLPANSERMPLSPRMENLFRRPGKSDETSNSKWFESLWVKKTDTELSDTDTCAPQPTSQKRIASDTTEAVNSSNAQWWSGLTLPKSNPGRIDPAKSFTTSTKHKASATKDMGGTQSPTKSRHHIKPLQKSHQRQMKSTIRL